MKLILNKKHLFCKFSIFILGILILGLTGCQFTLGDPASLPNVTSELIEANIRATSVIGGGVVTDEGKSVIVVKGICWSTKMDPTVDDSVTNDGAGTGHFTSQIKYLIPSTLYYIRAYAVNSVGGIYYGKSIGFKTDNPATVSTELTVTDITGTTASVGGGVIENNNDSIIAKGVCWSTRTNPTINDSITIDGTGSGNFVSKLRNLLPNTTYFVRAYATDYNGTVYGDAVGFVTKRLAYVITSADVTNITYRSATVGGNAVLDGGELITERGVCWGINQNPTIADSKSIDITGIGLGLFNANLTKLYPNTLYYTRAYATSIAGTSYGNEITFTTALSPTITDIDGNIYHTLIIGNQTWLMEDLKTTKLNDGTAIPKVREQATWASLSTPGYCWYNNDSTLSINSYGVLYNWYAVSTGKLAPIGWHVATDDDWTTLTTYLNDNGGKLKQTGTHYWISPNTGATNETKFTALPGGARGNNDGTFVGFGYNCYWWTSTELDNTNVWYRSLSNSNKDVDRSSSGKINGMSVRCVKD